MIEFGHDRVANILKIQEFLGVKIPTEALGYAMVGDIEKVRKIINRKRLMRRKKKK